MPINSILKLPNYINKEERDSDGKFISTNMLNLTLLGIMRRRTIKGFHS